VLRQLRAAAGVRLVQRQARLPVPSRLHQRHPPRPRAAKNLYVREDQILPRLAALAILHAGYGKLPQSRNSRREQIMASAKAADLIDQLRADDISLVYNPATGTENPMHAVRSFRTWRPASGSMRSLQ
jgi:hypothetical protein